jgi:hypothetical protein
VLLDDLESVSSHRSVSESFWPHCERECDHKCMYRLDRKYATPRKMFGEMRGKMSVIALDAVEGPRMRNTDELAKEDVTGP